MIMRDDWFTTGLIAAVAGLTGWFTKHITRSQIHPDRDELVTKEVCQANRDCIEVEVSSLGQKLEQFRADIKDDLKEIKDLLKGGGR